MSINIIKERAEDLCNLIEAQTRDLEEVLSKVSLIETQERLSKVKEKELEEVERKQVLARAAIKASEAHIIKTQGELGKKELSLARDRQLIGDIEQAQKEYEKAREESIVQEEASDRKLKQVAIEEEKLARERLTFLEEQKAKHDALDRREAIVSKRERIDERRKELLDIREVRIQTTEKRLAIEQAE